MGIQNYAVKEANNLQLGQAGSVYVADTNNYSGNFIAFQCRANGSSISSITQANTDGSFGGTTWNQGEWHFGEISQFQASAGQFILYKG